MAYDEFLADRIRRTLAEKYTTFEEKKMMGGICFLVDGKMCAGVTNDNLMARIRLYSKLRNCLPGADGENRNWLRR